MDVKNEITPIEIGGKDRAIGDDRRLVVESHWSCNRLVHLKWEGIDLLISAGDLSRAVQNAINHT